MLRITRSLPNSDCRQRAVILRSLSFTACSTHAFSHLCALGALAGRHPIEFEVGRSIAATLGYAIGSGQGALDGLSRIRLSSNRPKQQGYGDDEGRGGRPRYGEELQWIL